MHQLALTMMALFGPLWGVHPDTEDMTEPSVQDGRRAARHCVVAIGETGLDYYGMEDRKGGRTITDLEWQRSVFAPISVRRRLRKNHWSCPHPQQLCRHAGHFA